MNIFMKKTCDYIFNNQNFSEFNNKNILITGANGLLGGMIAEFFNYLNEEKGFNVNLYLTSKSKKSKASRIKHVLNSNKVKYFSCDLSKSHVFKKYINSKIDYCFYCAGYATPIKFIDYPIETLNINTNGLNNTLEFIINNNPNSHFLYISSAEVYSANDNTELYKETDTINIEIDNKRNFYKVGKIAGEMLINNFRDKGLKASSIRTTICYGPGVLDDDNRVLSDLTKKGIYNETIQLIDNGLSTRRLLHISDFCLMIFNIIKTCNSKVYNVNGDMEWSILEMANIIGEVLNKQIILGDGLHMIAKNTTNSVSMSINRYESEFGKHIFKSTKEGIKEFVEWYKTILR